MQRGRKAWVSRRKGREGWWVSWHDDGGKRRNKKFPNKTLAEQFAGRKTVELNDEFRQPDAPPPTMAWEALLAEYRQYLVFRGRKPSAITRRFLTIKTFQDTMRITKPAHVTQAALIEYIIKFRTRQTRFKKAPAEASIHSEIAHLRAFVNWASDSRRGYLRGPFDLEQDKAPPQWRKPVALRDTQMKKLLALFNDTTVVQHPDAWRVRILLAASCGLRRSDIENLKPADFDTETMSIRIREKKTGKFTLRPIHPGAWAMIWPYISSLPETAKRLFPDTHTSKKWEKICKAIGAPYPGFRYHDLRITFTSALAANDVPTGVAQKLLNHSTSRLTNDVYTDFDPTLRRAIDRVPVDAWIEEVNPAKEEAAGPAETPPSE